MRLLSAIVACATAIGCSGCEGCGPDPTPDAPIEAPARAQLSLTWRLVDPADQPLLCEQVGVQFVTLVLFHKKTGRTFSEPFDCFRHAATLELDQGEYTIRFDLSDTFGTLLTRPAETLLVAADSVKDEKFVVGTTGSLALNVQATTMTGAIPNCAGGAGITGMTIAINRANGTCYATQLQLEAPTGTYQVNCSSPVVESCLDATRRINVLDVPAGDYRIRVTGLVGPNACWTHDAVYRVRANGLGRTLLLPLVKSAGCT